MQGPFYSRRAYMYGNTFFDPEVPYYNNTRYHKKPAPREFPDNRPFDDGSQYVEYTDDGSGEMLRMNVPPIINIETWIEKRLKVVLYGLTEDDDKEYTLEIGRRYAIQYITENGLKTADGYLRFISSSVPDECTKYANNFSDAAMQAFIGMDCSTKGVSDKRKIYINTIRAIEELENDEDYTPPAIAGTIGDLLQAILRRVNYLENCGCEDLTKKILETVEEIKASEVLLSDLDKNGDGTISLEELTAEPEQPSTKVDDDF